MLAVFCIVEVVSAAVEKWLTSIIADNRASNGADYCADEDAHGSSSRPVATGV